jgi:hypothetical protein
VSKWRKSNRSKRVDGSCQNHGSCNYGKSSRLHSTLKQEQDDPLDLTQWWPEPGGETRLKESEEMTKYLSSEPFSVGGHSDQYAEGWDRVFGAKVVAEAKVADTYVEVELRTFIAKQALIDAVAEFAYGERNEDYLREAYSAYIGEMDSLCTGNCEGCECKK